MFSRREGSVFSNTIFSRYINSTMTNDFVIKDIGYERCMPDKLQVGPLCRTNAMIHYILSGNGTLTTGGITYKLKENEIFFIPSMQKHQYCQDRKNPWEYIWIEFTGEFSKTLCDRALFSAQNPVYLNTDLKIRDDLLTMYSYTDSGASFELHCLSHIYKFFASLIDNRNPHSQKTNYGKRSKIEEAIKYIDNNFTNPNLSLNSISEMLFVNPSYLSKIFSEIIGIPITKYVIQRRLQKACELLEQTSLNITEISASIGYSDPFFFSREFKKEYGICPSKYKPVDMFVSDKDK